MQLLCLTGNVHAEDRQVARGDGTKTCDGFRLFCPSGADFISHGFPACRCSSGVFEGVNQICALLAIECGRLFSATC